MCLYNTFEQSSLHYDLCFFVAKFDLITAVTGYFCMLVITLHTAQLKMYD